VAVFNVFFAASDAHCLVHSDLDLKKKDNSTLIVYFIYFDIRDKNISCNSELRLDEER
jgi:hypothetical protein